MFESLDSWLKDLASEVVLQTERLMGWVERLSLSIFPPLYLTQISGPHSDNHTFGTHLQPIDGRKRREWRAAYGIRSWRKAGGGGRNENRAKETSKWGVQKTATCLHRTPIMTSCTRCNRDISKIFTSRLCRVQPLRDQTTPTYLLYTCMVVFHLAETLYLHAICACTCVLY